MATLHCTFQLFLFLLFAITHPTFQQSHPQPTLSTVDFAALISIKNSLTDLPASTFFSSWDLTSPHPCSSFLGLTCSLFGTTLRVTSLSLGSGYSGSLGLAGSLSKSLSQLTELTQLVLNPGLVTGPIPPQLGRLTNLRILSLAHNRLTGPIPSTLATLTRLHTLDLSFNHLTGPIPPSLLTELTQLKVLILANNQLNGNLPSLTRLNQLYHLDIKSNRLVGPIPPYTLPLKLRYVSLAENMMWGPINNGQLESLSELVYLDLSVNQFSGTLPSSLLNPTLSSLYLSHNNFTGPITHHADVIISYPVGSVIDLSHNAFSGELPKALAGAETVCLNNNRFSGPVQDSYVAGLMLGRIKILFLQHNFLDTFPKKLSDWSIFPDDVEVCLVYNCMVPPLGFDSCPANAGNQLSRPAGQCYIFHNN